MNLRRLFLLASALLVLTGSRQSMTVAAELRGGAYSVLGRPVAAAGDVFGGEYSLRGLTGLPTHVTVSAGPWALGPLILEVAAPPDSLRVSIEWIQEDEVRMAWTPGPGSFRLETTENPWDAGSWRPVTPAPEGRIYTRRIDVPARFFRLRRD